MACDQSARKPPAESSTWSKVRSPALLDPDPHRDRRNGPKRAIEKILDAEGDEGAAMASYLAMGGQQLVAVLEERMIDT